MHTRGVHKNLFVSSVAASFFFLSSPKTKWNQNFTLGENYVPVPIVPRNSSTILTGGHHTPLQGGLGGAKKDKTNKMELGASFSFFLQGWPADEGWMNETDQDYLLSLGMFIKTKMIYFTIIIALLVLEKSNQQDPF